MSINEQDEYEREDDDGETEGSDAQKLAADARYWVAWIKSAKSARREFLDMYRDAQREYLGSFSPATNRAVVRQPKVYRLPVFWSTIQSVLPAYYSSAPIPVVDAEWSSYDPVARVGATICERLARYGLKTSGADATWTSTATTFLIGNKATDRVIFDEEEYTDEAVYVSEQVVQAEDGSQYTVYIDGNGDQAPEGATILTDDDGKMYYEKEELEKCVKLIPLSPYDVLHTPTARYWHEIKAIAFRIVLTRDEARDMFGADAERLAFGTRDDDLGEDRPPGSDNPDGPNAKDAVAEVWEIWNKEDKTVFYISEAGFPKLLKKEGADSEKIPDPYKLTGFFPCAPFAMGTCVNTGMNPIPDHNQLKDLFARLNDVYKRVVRLARSTRRRGLYDSNVAELATLQTDADEAEFLPVANFRELIGEGGLSNVVQYFPVEQLTAAMQEMVQMLEFMRELINELYGLPDVIRGTSSPVETAEAQKIKERNASLRFRARQKSFQELVRKDLELMVDLYLRQLNDAEIAEVVGARYMSPEEQAVFGPALALVRTDRWRTLRINIETDSTVLPNEEETRKRKLEVVNTITQGLQQVASVQGLPPPLIDLMGKLITYSMVGMRDAKALLSQVEGAIAASIQAMQPPAAPPPPPDYEGEKLRLQGEKQTAEIQLEVQRLQMEMQAKGAELEIARQKLQIEAEKAGASAAVEQQRTMLDKQIAEFEATIKQLELELARQSMVLTEREKFMTEQRLQLEASLKQQKAIAEQQALAAQIQGQQVQPIEFKIEQPKPVKRKYKIKRTPFGDTQIETEVEEPTP